MLKQSLGNSITDRFTYHTFICSTGKEVMNPGRFKQFISHQHTRHHEFVTALLDLKPHGGGMEAGPVNVKHTSGSVLQLHSESYMGCWQTFLLFVLEKDIIFIILVRK